MALALPEECLISPLHKSVFLFREPAILQAQRLSRVGRVLHRESAG